MSTRCQLKTLPIESAKYMWLPSWKCKNKIALKMSLDHVIVKKVDEHHDQTVWKFERNKSRVEIIETIATSKRLHTIQKTLRKKTQRARWTQSNHMNNMHQNHEHNARKHEKTTKFKKNSTQRLFQRLREIPPSFRPPLKITRWRPTTNTATLTKLTHKHTHTHIWTRWTAPPPKPHRGWHWLRNTWNKLSNQNCSNQINPKRIADAQLGAKKQLGPSNWWSRCRTLAFKNNKTNNDPKHLRTWTWIAHAVPIASKHPQHAKQSKPTPLANVANAGAVFQSTTKQIARSMPLGQPTWRPIGKRDDKTETLAKLLVGRGKPTPCGPNLQCSKPNHHWPTVTTTNKSAVPRWWKNDLRGTLDKQPQPTTKRTIKEQQLEQSNHNFQPRKKNNA